jgi:hypothetical protein
METACRIVLEDVKRSSVTDSLNDVVNSVKEVATFCIAMPQHIAYSIVAVTAIRLNVPLQRVCNRVRVKTAQ